MPHILLNYSIHISKPVMEINETLIRRRMEYFLKLRINKLEGFPTICQYFFLRLFFSFIRQTHITMKFLYFFFPRAISVLFNPITSSNLVFSYVNLVRTEYKNLPNLIVENIKKDEAHPRDLVCTMCPFVLITYHIID